MRWRAAVPAAVTVVALAGWGAADAFAQEAKVPALGLSASSVEAGQTVLVTGRDWPAGAIVDLGVCGGGGLGTSTDCAVETARQAVADDAGAFTAALPVAIPPTPCPCVVRGSTGGASVNMPLSIPGAPVGLPSEGLEGPAARLEVDTAVEGAGPWTAWLGASPQRTLVVTVRNAGDAAVRSPELAVMVDDGGGAPRTVTTRSLDPLGPGDEVTERIGVGLGGLAWGASTLRAEVSGAGAPVAAETETSSYPWALLAVVVLVLQALLLGIRNRIRRRIAVEPEPVAAVAEPLEPLALPAPVEFIDLTETDDEPVAEPGPVTIETIRPTLEVPVPVDHDDLLREELARYHDLTSSASEAVAQTRRSVADASVAADRSVRQAVASFEVQVATATAALEGALGAWRAEVATLCEELQREAAEARAKETETVAAADAVTASLLDAVRVATSRIAERVPESAPAPVRPEPPLVLDLVDHAPNGRVAF